MSLTSILSSKSNQELRDRFKTDFLRPAFSLQAELKAPPLTNNYGTVGTAFDYLLRFYLQHHNKNTFVQREHWVADHSYRMLTNGLSKKANSKIATGFHQDKVFKAKDLLKIITDQYAQTKVNYTQFISNGLITDDLISNTIFLAKLDAYFRAGIIDQNFDNHNPDDIQDLKGIISLVDKKHFTANDKCYFNPTFGDGSMIVGGADADLIIDNTLIDIKATKHLKLEREHLNQVLGYYILSLIGGVNENPHDRPIENIGIYFARHGQLWTIPLIHFGNQQKFEDFKIWFMSFVSRGRPSLADINELLKTVADNEKKKPLRKTAKKKTIEPRKVKTKKSVKKKSVQTKKKRKKGST